jgi:hypothetical protein
MKPVSFTYHRTGSLATVETVKGGSLRGGDREAPGDDVNEFSKLADHGEGTCCRTYRRSDESTREVNPDHG